MDKLSAALHRLHLLPGDSATTARRTLGLAFGRAADWQVIATVWRAVQEELALPPPAVSIDGEGYRLWFSFAEALPPETAARFLSGLNTAYLTDVTAFCQPFDADNTNLPPCELPGDERWAAFIDPSLGTMFMVDPWLDIPPNRDQQAELLAGCRPIPAADLRRALDRLSSPAEPDTPPPQAAPDAGHSLPGPFADPCSFLLAVMNDPHTNLALRIEAAKALLPHARK